MDSLRSLFRWMLLGWLALVLLMGLAVAWSARSHLPGNLLTFLLTREGPSETAVSPPPVPPDLPVSSAPAPSVTPAPEPGWTPLKEGSRVSSGSRGAPEITVLPGGAVEVRFLCQKPGNYRLYRPTNVSGLSVDLPGNWGRRMVDRHLAQGKVRRVQIADHPGWLRVSGMAREEGKHLVARVEHSPRAGAVRIVFDVGR